MPFSDDQHVPDLADLDRYPRVRIPIKSVLAADWPRCSGENRDHTQLLAESAEPWPPILVHRKTRRVIDGMHRLLAAKLRDEHQIDARYFDGDDTDAFLLAVRANTRHGLPLSRADRKVAAVRIIASHPQLSDRAIAATVGLAPETVAHQRRSPAEHGPAVGCPTAQSMHSDTRLGRDGRVRPLNGAKGREAAGRLIAAQPGASLREIARQAGISPETVRDVRARLRRGESPVPPRQEAADHGDDRDAPDRAAVAATRARRLGVLGGRPRTGEPPAAEAAEAAPALRHNEAGRALLRMMETQRVIERQGELFIKSVPAHCRGRVAAAARACARKYQALAERIVPDLQAL